ncbi:hypothetical protein [Paenarthrobacter sp. A20]|uniref:hypothetical protein n=1 Tax=Paenarthrobacter sp. A20 TaxID=2817891 RepID=UPI00209D270A|nr:hypothetical protein [Paenarthrobacter sp. A20]MCP1413852.1 DNA-binding HxlR family transcriptional regulator [Paenarthrobacter sp. A20]
MTSTANTYAPRTSVERIKAHIINYLDRHGASPITDITNAVPACRDTIRTRLAELEQEGSVQVDIPAGQRWGSTPYYSLTALPTKEHKPLQPPRIAVTVYISDASDGRLGLAFDDYPGLTSTARSFVDIPNAARTAAARHTHLPAEIFTILIRF